MSAERRVPKPGMRYTCLTRGLGFYEDIHGLEVTNLQLVPDVAAKINSDGVFVMQNGRPQGQ